LCYRYTIPQWISEQIQSVSEVSGSGGDALVAGRLACIAPFYSLPPGLGKRGFHPCFYKGAIDRRVYSRSREQLAVA
jgi:hypothetical protein